jgi:hypothetical protein
MHLPWRFLLGSRNESSLSQDVVTGLGTFAGLNEYDHVLIQYIPTATPPFIPGTATLNIPWQFQVGSGAPKTFSTVIQQFQLAPDGMTLTASKAGAIGKCKVSDATDNGSPPF